ncbi:hypothetical protein QEH42_gp152 [Microbacterium phage Pumpernickel]|uniref:Uncharacterized protein n=1 Tax=Microbacterium phage Pumpernickel TaxID=2885983 RepID=A0AAE9C319_9CAUD|nr:hypothetical protein QEH42_gp015 [Microbacterium phage Pumpernickel]YP_010755306.1 hypothetical protein QEH42_gp152 [Microbacterium phage Pumpernickel]UDL15806.1 hypothetical protein SEA_PUMPERNICKEL_15 [Microbacterium phage Pumpernickel]UDL16066.1 hypothetical protein SEA_PUMPERNICKEL_316 [Microbacterium phage Pumpernickel]
MAMEAKRCETITGVTLQQFAERMSERQAKEVLKVMVGTVESHGPFVLDFKAIDQIFRHMVQ